MPSAATENPLIEALVTSRPRLLAIAKRIVSSPELAEDVVQTATLRAWTMQTACPDCPFSFACRMVQNLAVDCLRKRRCEGPMITFEDFVCIALEALPDRYIEDRQTLAKVVSAISDLPVPTRQAFLAHRLDGVRQKDIAAAMKLSTSRVNDMIRNAEARCRRALEN